MPTARQFIVVTDTPNPVRTQGAKLVEITSIGHGVERSRGSYGSLCDLRDELNGKKDR